MTSAARGQLPGPRRPDEALPLARLARLVDTAVDEGRLRLAYQPVVDMPSGATVGCEALVRMVDRTGRVLPPDEFLPLAEETGAIHGIGEWVLRTACTQAAVWKQALPAGSDFGLGVNLSPRQLDDPALLDTVDSALADSGLPHGALVLELTERLLTEVTPAVLTQLRGIRDRGVHLAADDFGTGFCSVRYLLDLPFDTLKIDRSWTCRLGEPGFGGRLATGVVRLAVSSGLVTIVEGVETAYEQELVLGHGLVLGQGYLYARPLPAEQFTADLVTADLVTADLVAVPVRLGA